MVCCFLPNKIHSFERDTAPGAQLRSLLAERNPFGESKVSVDWNVSPRTRWQRVDGSLDSVVVVVAVIAVDRHGRASRSNPSFVLDEIFRPRRLKKKGDEAPACRYETRLSPDSNNVAVRCLPAKEPAGGSPPVNILLSDCGYEKIGTAASIPTPVIVS